MTRNYCIFILNRMLSGIVNGLYYANSTWVWPVLFVLAIFTFLELYENTYKNIAGMNDWTIALSLIGMFGSILCCTMLGLSFAHPKFYFSDIHLWTFLHQTAIAGTYFFSSKKPLKQLWWLILAVSPSAFLQKLFINIIPGNNWDYMGTDDPTGHFWNMKIFGINIMVPRLADMQIKLVIALLCVITFFIVRYLLKKPVDID